MKSGLVVMDVGDVLVHTVPMAQHRALARRTGQTWEAVADVIEGSGVVTAFETGEVSGLEFADTVRALLSEPDLSYDEICDDWNSVVAAVDPVMVPATALLAAAGRLILASNTNPFHWQAVRRRLADAGIVAPACLSFEVGYAKPDPRYFVALRNRHPLIAEGALFVDDRLDNVEAGARHGLAGWHHKSPAETSQHLAELMH